MAFQGSSNFEVDRKGNDEARAEDDTSNIELQKEKSREPIVFATPTSSYFNFDDNTVNTGTNGDLTGTGGAAASGAEMNFSAIGKYDY